VTSPPAKPWHAWGGDEVARTFASDPERGLSRAEAAQRLVRDGPNELHPERGPTRRTLLARQFQSLVVWLLIGAALVSRAG
jgi:Ca2+-transporting ATPase